MTHSERIPSSGSKIINKRSSYAFFKSHREDVDLNKINDDLFSISLMFSVANTASNCAFIDDKVLRTGCISYLPGLTSMEQYEFLLELMNIKRELRILYNTFEDFYVEELTEPYKQLYINYFVRKKLSSDTNTSSNYKQRIIYMGRRFRIYLRDNANMDKRTLLNNPYIYTEYLNVLAKQEFKAGRKK